MMRNISELGPREAEFLATVAAEGKSLFGIERAQEFWGSDQYARNAVAHLEHKGWVERLERGSYLIVPLEAGVSRQWSEDPIAVGTFLAPDGAAAYWTAIRHWGWTTQLPGEYLFITPRRRSRLETRVLGVRYRFVVLKQERIFGIETVWMNELRARVTSRERTIVDMLDRPDLCGGIAEVAESLRVAWPDVDALLIAKYAERFGSGTVPKRLGFLAEQLALPGASQHVERWRELVGSGYSPLDRGGPGGGRLVRRWNLRINASGFDQASGERHDS
jgi:predicted transcriptional regulator of viral defense system